MGTIGIRVITALLAIATFGQPGPAAGEEEPALTDLVQILRQEGVIDDEQYAQLSSKAEKKQNQDKWYERFSMWGELRLRWESFFYDRDATGNKRDDRNRVRYRLRINTKVRVNEHMNVLFRIGTGASDSRSGNQTLGSGVDFDRDTVAIAPLHQIEEAVAEGAARGNSPDDDHRSAHRPRRLPLLSGAAGRKRRCLRRGPPGPGRSNPIRDFIGLSRFRGSFSILGK